MSIKSFIIGCCLALTSACAANSGDTKLTLADLLDGYVAPSVCSKMSECDVTFAVRFPNGIAQCVDFVKRSITGDRSQATGCTAAQAKVCVDDQKALMCPATKAPPSCDVCTYDSGAK